MLIYAKSKETLRKQGTIWREPKPGAKEIWDYYLRLREIHNEDFSAIEDARKKNGTNNYQKSIHQKLISRYKHVDQYGPWRDRDIILAWRWRPTLCCYPSNYWKTLQNPRQWMAVCYSRRNAKANRYGAGNLSRRWIYKFHPYRKAHLKIQFLMNY